MRSRTISDKTIAQFTKGSTPRRL